MPENGLIFYKLTKNDNPDFYHAFLAPNLLLIIPSGLGKSSY